MFRKKEKPWWEKEAEEQCLPVYAYLTKLKLEKENAELELAMLKKKEEARSRREKWDNHQAEQLEAAKEKVKGYEQIAQMHSAYISILLKRLGATEENKVDIQAKEVTEALSRYEARAEAIEGGFALYYTEPLEGEKAD